MTIGSALFQGIVQGLTEFLPISSSGHLSLVQYFTGIDGETGAFFTIMLHLGTLLAVFIAFHKTITGLIVEFFSMIGDIFRGRFSVKNAPPQRRMVLLLIVSLLPMALSFLLLDFFNKVSSDNDIIVEGICFLITSLLLFLSVKCVKGHKKAKDTKYRDALVVGLFQAVAPMPGISRSGSTISAGLFVGMDREFAVAFSFIMGIPPVLGANLMEIKDVAQNGFSVPIPVLAVGLVTSLVFGLLAIKMVRWLVASDKFKYFAWYTLVLGLLTVTVGVVEQVANHPIQQMFMGMLAG